MLHLVTRCAPQIPVILIDTGYLFPETYRFIDALTDRLGLNLKVYRSQASPAWQESRWGRLWEQGVEGIARYNRLNKVEPMERALRELSVRTWFSGLRRVQARTRAEIQPVQLQRGRCKVYPIFDWTDREVGAYLRKHGLPYHPLWEKGFVSIGDVNYRLLADLLAGSIPGILLGTWGVVRAPGVLIRWAVAALLLVSCGRALAT